MKITANHEKIRKWAEKYGGKPQIIKDPDAKADEVGIRIDFPGNKDGYYEPNSGKDEKNVSWDVFFQEFERQDLQLEYDEVVNIADPGMSYRFLKRQPVEEAPPVKPEDVL